jgi:beta-glucosidase
VGFRRVRVLRLKLRPGQTGHVTFTLNDRSFSHWDVAGHGWKVTPGWYEIMVGGGSRDIRLRGTIRMGAR